MLFTTTDKWCICHNTRHKSCISIKNLLGSLWFGLHLVLYLVPKSGSVCYTYLGTQKNPSICDLIGYAINSHRNQKMARKKKKPQTSMSLVDS